MALVKSYSDPGVNILEMMNTGKALSMIMAIFVSVAIAFFFGAVVQYIARLIFSFSYKGPGLKWKIGITGGIAATALIWFMLIKGLKDVAFISPETLGWIHSHGWIICLCCVVVTGIISHILYLLKINVFKILVLLGTFALAMAFAGNDLVNFIGVPLAGLDAFRDYTANGGGDPSGFMMSSLDGPASTSPLILIAAGAIMVISLATSKKAFNVVNTSVGLSKQGDGDEMFGSSRVARVLVRASINAGTAISSFIPERFRNWADTRFRNDAVLPEGAAFDEIRATVNLVLASLLIALGTSLKLPLSTTYVTFMVAMGSSLADRAWGRDSAVFRITGVISVIGGWLITAGAAFILSFLTGLLMCAGGMVAAGLLIALAIFLLIRSHIEFTRKKAEDKGDVLFEKILSSNDKEETLRLFGEHFNGNMASFLEFANETYLNITDGFICDNLGKLRKADSALRKERMELKQIRRKDMLCIRRIDAGIAIEKNTWVHLGSNSCEDILYCLKRMCDPCEEHIDNNFAPLPEERIKEFLPMRDTLLYLLRRASDIIGNADFRDTEKVREQCEKFKESLSELRRKQINRMQSEQENITVSYVYLTMLQETQEIANGIRHSLRAASHFSENDLDNQ